MEANFGQWIERVREKPEHVRRRYVFLCVAVSMAFILGVWFLTVSESFRTVSSETGSAANGARNILPNLSNSSIDEFLKSDKPLGSDENSNVSGQQFFESQSQAKSQPNFDEEGIQPVEDNGSAPAAAPPAGQ